MQTLFSVRQGYFLKAGFGKIASNIGDSGVYIVPKPARNFGYVGTWLNISELFGRTFDPQGGGKGLDMEHVKFQKRGQDLVESKFDRKQK